MPKIQAKAVAAAACAALAVSALPSCSCAPQQEKAADIVVEKAEEESAAGEPAAPVAPQPADKPARQAQRQTLSQPQSQGQVFAGWFETQVPDGWRFSETWERFAMIGSTDYAEPFDDEAADPQAGLVGTPPASLFWDAYDEEGPQEADGAALDPSSPFDPYGRSATYPHADELWTNGADSLVAAAFVQEPSVEFHVDDYDSTTKADDFDGADAPSRAAIIADLVRAYERYLRVDQRGQVETAEIDMAGFHWHAVTEKLDGRIVAQTLVTDSPNHRAITVVVTSGSLDEPWARTLVENFKLVEGDPFANYGAYRDARIAEEMALFSQEELELLGADDLSAESGEPGAEDDGEWDGDEMSGDEAPEEVEPASGS